jgi:hypothetical protein
MKHSRLYGPAEAVINKSWKLGYTEKGDQSTFAVFITRKAFVGSKVFAMQAANPEVRER